jgi:hypothetical protein
MPGSAVDFGLIACAGGVVGRATSSRKAKAPRGTA